MKAGQCARGSAQSEKQVEWKHVLSRLQTVQFEDWANIGLYVAVQPRLDHAAANA
jgi:hypothetical protein